MIQHLNTLFEIYLNRRHIVDAILWSNHYQYVQARSMKVDDDIWCT